MSRSIHRTLVGVFLGLLVGLSGCLRGNPKTAVVKGIVTYNGKPVPNGTVLFIPQTPGPTATGEINADGSYSLTTFAKGDGAVLGKHKVVIQAIQNMGSRLPEDRTPLPPPLVPDKYTSPATSDLEADVQAKENTLDFKLTGELYQPKKR
jgi:hypothetical protein